MKIQKMMSREELRKLKTREQKERTINKILELVAEMKARKLVEEKKLMEKNGISDIDR